MAKEFTDFEKLAMEMAGSPAPQEPTPAPEPVENTEPVNTDEDLPEESVDNVEETEDVEEPTAQVEPTTAEEEENVSDNLEIDDWDDAPEADVTPEKTFDFSELGKALNDETIKSQEDVISRMQELKTKVSELEKIKDSALDDVPEDLKKAIELSKSGADYLNYLGISSVDYAQVDPVELFEYEVTQMFTDKDGNVNEEKLSEYLDNLPEVDKELRGRQIQKQYIAEQQSRKEQFAQEAQRKRAESDVQLQKVLSSTEAIAGFKLKPSHKKSLYEDITSGKMMKELFYGKDGKYDFQKVVETAFKAKNFDKIQNHLRQQVRSSTKKEILNDVTNSNVKSPPQQPNAAPKTKSALDSYLESLMPK